MSFFHTILNYINKNKKSLIYIALFIFVFYISSEFSFADDTPSTGDSSSSGTSWDDPNIFVQVVNGLVKMSSALLGLLTFLVGLFLYPGWTSGSAIGLTDPLKTMWILVSNVVYFIFAFIFIWIAFMNIIGKEDNYQLKQAIPRFIVGVLIVPFSWFFVQFVISLSSILTVGILTLPYDTFKGTTFFSDTALQKVSFCDSYIVNMGGNSEGEFPIKCKEGHNDQVTLEKILNPQDSNSLFGIMAFYTYGVMKLDANGVLHREDVGSSLKSFFDMGLKAIFDILFIIVYLLLMIALALALFVRGIMLWVFGMFSPIFGLLFFFKKGGEGIGEGAAKKFNIQQFINLALVPVYVAGALAFGLVFIFIAGEGLGATSSSGDGEFSMSGNLVKFGGFEFMLSGAVSDSSLRTGSEVDKGIKGYDGTLGTLLLHLFGLGILWMAVMAALKSSEITGSAVEPIAQFGSSVGDLIKKSPTYAPIIPTPSGMMSGAALGRAGSTFTGTIDQAISQKGTAFGTDMARRFGADSDSSTAQMNRVINETNSGLLNTNSGVKDFVEKLTKAAGDIDNFLLDQQAKAKFAEGLKMAGVGNETILNEIRSASSATQLGNTLAKIVTDAQTKEVLRTELRRMGWSTNTGAIASFRGDSSTNLGGDVNQTTINDFNGETNGLGANIGVTREVKVKLDGDFGRGQVAIKDTTGNTGNMYSVNFQNTLKNAQTFTGQDMDEAVKLYEMIGNIDDFVSILDKLGFDNSSDLAQKVKEKSES